MAAAALLLALALRSASLAAAGSEVNRNEVNVTSPEVEVNATNVTSSDLVALTTASFVHHIWPATAYASIACGGVWDNAQQSGYGIASILGSSGGASAALFVLAYDSLAKFKEVYDEYSSWNSFFSPADTTHCDADSEDNCWWQAAYVRAMGTSSSSPGFQRVKSKGRVSTSCAANKGGAETTYVLYNFASPLQAAQIYAAAGGGAGVYHHVDGVGWCTDWDTMSANSDGIPTEMNTQDHPVWYYNTWAFMSECCIDSFFLCTPWWIDGYSCVDALIARGRSDYFDPAVLQVNPWWAHGWAMSSMTATWRDLSA